MGLPLTRNLHAEILVAVDILQGVGAMGEAVRQRRLLLASPARLELQDLRFAEADIKAGGCAEYRQAVEQVLQLCRLAVKESDVVSVDQCRRATPCGVFSGTPAVGACSRSQLSKASMSMPNRVGLSRQPCRTPLEVATLSPTRPSPSRQS